MIRKYASLLTTAYTTFTFGFSMPILFATRDAILINEFQLPPSKNHRNFYCNHDR